MILTINITALLNASNMEVKRSCMLTFVIVVVFCLFEEVIPICTGVNSMTSEGIRNGEKLAEEPFITYQNTSGLYSCAELCMVFTRCSSFNYNTLSQDCELNQNDTSTGTIAVDADYKLSDIRTWPMNLAGDCMGRGCDSSSICVQTQSTFSCVAYHL